MKPLLVVAGLLVALAGMGVLAYVSLRPSPQAEPSPPSVAPEPEPEPESAAPATLELRPYVTRATLREDLRDALADDGANLDSETWRVSKRVASEAKQYIIGVGFAEKSPRVRGLVVLAAGVHVPYGGEMEVFLRDRFAVVREAAVLALGSRPGATDDPAHLYLDRVIVPIGRELTTRVTRRLERLREEERDERVLAALAAVLRG